MARRITADQMIAEVRALLDEDNLANISDDLDILPALNRAQDVAHNILARHYESPLIKSLEIGALTADTAYDIPEDALEQRLEKVEAYYSSTYHEVQREDYRNITNFDLPSTTAIPLAYVVTGNQYRLYPRMSASSSLRIWYSQDPGPLVKSQGRIQGPLVGGAIDISGNYLTLATLESTTELTSDVTNLDAYVNLIDGDTGIIKATLQVESIDASCNRVTFKSTPDRLSVLNQTVVGAIPTTVEPDDFICLIHGRCVPIVKKPNTNFIIQYAVADIKINKLGEPADAQLRLRAELEKQVERSWVGRESTLKVKGKSDSWVRSFKRRWN